MGRYTPGGRCLPGCISHKICRWRGVSLCSPMKGNHFQEATMRGRSLEMRTTLALLCCPWSEGLPRLDRGVAQTIAALDQVFQPLGEACCRSAIEHLVIKTDRQTEIVPDSYVPVNDTRLLAN